MSSGERVFRFRIKAGEYRRLRNRAEKEGLTMSDVIRQALGWSLRQEPPRPPSEAAEKVQKVAARTGAVDPEAEPGAAALQQIADRIAGKG